MAWMGFRMVRQQQLKNAVGLRTAIAMLFLVLPWQLVGQERATELCSISEISVSQVPGAGFEIRRHFILVADAALGYIDIENRAERTILSGTLIVEYIGSDEQPLFSIVYEFMTEEHYDCPRSNVVARCRQILARAIGHGETVRLEGVSATISAACPSGARIVFARLNYQNGTSYSWATPGWGTAPTLRAAKEHYDLSDVSATFPLSVSARLEVDEVGRVENVLFAGRIGAGLEDWIRTNTSLWEFHPALRDGQPVRSDVTLLFRFHEPRRYSGLIDRASIPVPTTIVDFATDEAGTWKALYGGFPVGTGTCETWPQHRSYP